MDNIKLLMIILIFTRKSMGNFILVDRGIKPYLTNSMALTFYATVVSDRTSQRFSVPERTTRLKMMLCCQIKSTNKNDDYDESSVNEIEMNPNWDCESMKIYSGLAIHLHPNQSCTLTAFFLNKYILNRRGVCTFKISQLDSIPPFSINFDTRITNENHTLTLWQTKIPGTVCSSLDEDPVRNCEPTDCTTKYSGFRSFYNLKKRICEPTPTCLQTNGNIQNNLTEMHREEHHPIMVLDLETNACLNVSSHLKARIKSRSADGSNKDSDSDDDDHEKISTVQAFTAAYGLTLTKLGIAILLTCVFVLVIGVMVHFCFGCWCARRQSTRLGKYDHKYKALRDEHEHDDKPHQSESSSNVIKEIKDRREMKSKPLPPEEKSPNPDSKRRDSSETPKTTDPSSKTPTSPTFQTPPKSPSKSSQNNVQSLPSASPTKISQRSTDSVHSSKRLPNVVQFLHQLQNFRHRRCDKQSNDYIDLASIYGGTTKGKVRSLDTESTVNFQRRFMYSDDTMPNDSLVGSSNGIHNDPSSQMINIGTTPKFNQVIHKIQEESQDNSQHSTIVQQTQSRPKSTVQKNVKMSNIDSPTRGQLPSWASVSSFNTTNSVYRQEITDARNFMKEISNRHYPAEYISSQKSPSYDSHQLIRRIKDEPPIPMSMIYEGVNVKFNEMTPLMGKAPKMCQTELQITKDHKESNNSKSTQSNQANGCYATKSTSCRSMSKPEFKNEFIQVSRTQVEDKYNLLSFDQLKSQQTQTVQEEEIEIPIKMEKCTSVKSSSSKNNCNNYPLGNHKIVMSKSSPRAAKSVSFPSKDESTICNFFQFSNPEFMYNLTVDTPQTSAAEKIYKSALLLQQKLHDDELPSKNSITPIRSNDFDYYNPIQRPCPRQQLERGDSNYEITNQDYEELEDASENNHTHRVFKMMQEINSQHLVHSPPTLTNSELSCDGSSTSDLPTQVLKNEIHFWDDEFQPEQRPSESDQALQRQMWIDNFVTMSKPKGSD